MPYFKILSDLISMEANLPARCCGMQLPEVPPEELFLSTAGLYGKDNTTPGSAAFSEKTLQAAFLGEKWKPHCTILPINAA